jgi:hypothetical protein
MFGVEAANYCYCGNNLNLPHGSAIVPADECSVACAGNAQEICGANWRINLYRSTATREAATAAANSSIGTPDSGSTSRSLTICLSLGVPLASLIVGILGLLFGTGLLVRLRYQALR